MIKETCSCGAQFEIHDQRWSNPDWHSKGPTVEQQEVAVWRRDHRHEFPSAPEPAIPERLDVRPAEYDRWGK